MLERLRAVRLSYSGQLVTGEQLQKIKSDLLQRLKKQCFSKKPFSYHEVGRAIRLASHAIMKDIANPETGDETPQNHVQ